MQRAGAVAFVLLLVAAAAASGYARRDREAPPEAVPTLPLVPHQGSLTGLGPFTCSVASDRPPAPLEQVRTALATAYYRHVSPRLLAQPSIELMLERLGDPYTEYLDP